jgi:hypothetical protein
MEQTTSLAFLALLGGFLFAHQCHFTRFRASRAESHRLVYLSAGWGLALVVMARAALLGFRWLAPQAHLSLKAAWSAFAPVGMPALATGALTLGLVLPWLVNLVFSRSRVSRLLIKTRGSELEKLLYASANSGIPVSLTLKNLKVYVGWPTATPDPSKAESMSDIRLQPILSGHRDKDNQKLTFTTTYERVYDAVESNELPEMKVSDFQIVIPVTEITSANLFSLTLDQALFVIEGAPLVVTASS